MDPVSIVFAVLPLLAGAVKAYISVRKRCKVIHHFPRELLRLRRKLERQQQIFANESHLLVRIAISDDGIIEQMLEDPKHSQWHNSELEAALKTFLANSYDAYREIVEEVCTMIQVLEDELCKCDVPRVMPSEGNSSKPTAPRLTSRVTMACNTSGFEKTINSLRELNGDLGRLRQQACELRMPWTNPPDRLKTARMCSGYRDYQTIRKASKGLHQALMDGWSEHVPSTASSTSHDVKLFSNARVKEGVQLDLAIQCHGHAFSRQLYVTKPAWSILQVRSQALEWVDTGWNTPPASDDESRSKRRRVQSDNNFNASRNAAIPIPRVHTPTPDDFDEEVSESADTVPHVTCLGLQRNGHKKPSTYSPYFLGYADNSSEAGFRHSFYQTYKAEHTSKLTIRSQAIGMSYTMSDILAEALDGCQSVLRQLILARYVVATVLKFYSTPWLSEYVTAKDILFLGKIESSDLARHIETMHLGSSFVHAHKHQCPDLTMEDPGSSKAFEDARFQYGVRNVTLWCLGTMLLQIACWRQIDAADDVCTIRRLSYHTYCPGPRYQRLTKKCLDCDFGYGDDLSQPRLQQAVYQGLICELNDMIQSLDMDSED
ncbi:uncharacterized protein PG986_000515 [Apiospora aurea]|uniref:Prion-inhibition and propagation HeLo domain-containing protein n=1 Tax=Apiospora aurea TaxID=335848 RepID=A0ABR1QU98_9PEZI